MFSSQILNLYYKLNHPTSKAYSEWYFLCGVTGNELTQRETWIQVPALFLKRCVTEGKSPDISGLWFLTCRMRKGKVQGSRRSTYTTALNKFGELINIIQTNDYLKYLKRERCILYCQGLLIG